MQRLFSTFASGWPGVGLLLLRLLTGRALIYFGIASLLDGASGGDVVLQIIGIAAGILLLIGLWTPVAGALAAVVEGRGSLCRGISRIPAIPGFPSYRRSSAPFWRWSDLAHGPSMPACSAGSTSIFRNASGASYYPQNRRIHCPITPPRCPNAWGTAGRTNRPAS